MASTYKKLKNFDGSENNGAILRTSPSPETWIPFDPANTDYQEYLKWLNGEDPYTEKGTPEAAD